MMKGNIIRTVDGLKRGTFSATEATFTYKTSDKVFASIMARFKKDGIDVMDKPEEELEGAIEDMYLVIKTFNESTVSSLDASLMNEGYHLEVTNE